MRSNILWLILLMIVLLHSCSTTRPPSVVAKAEIMNEVVEAVIEERFSRRYYWKGNEPPGFMLNRQVCFNDTLNPYNFLHAEYEYYLTSGKEGNDPITSKSDGLEIDWGKLIPMLRDTIVLTAIDSVGEVPIRNTYGIDFHKDCFSFMPLIPTNKEGVYIVLFQLFKDRENPYYFMQVEKLADGYKVTRLDWNDFIYPYSPRFSDRVDWLQRDYDELMRKKGNR